MVPKVGLEPTRDCSHQILSLACLPIPPLRHISYKAKGEIIPTYSLKNLNGALGETRTRTRLLPPPPQDGVSTNSTTSAKNLKQIL